MLLAPPRIGRPSARSTPHTLALFVPAPSYPPSLAPLSARSRSDPVRLMRTLACQLGEALPFLRRHLLALEPEEVAGLEDNVEEAFNTLLLGPLSAVEVGGNRRVSKAEVFCGQDRVSGLGR